MISSSFFWTSPNREEFAFYGVVRGNTTTPSSGRPVRRHDHCMIVSARANKKRKWRAKPNTILDLFSTTRDGNRCTMSVPNISSCARASNMRQPTCSHHRRPFPSREGNQERKVVNVACLPVKGIINIESVLMHLLPGKA